MTEYLADICIEPVAFNLSLQFLEEAKVIIWIKSLVRILRHCFWQQINIYSHICPHKLLWEDENDRLQLLDWLAIGLVLIW